MTDAEAGSADGRVQLWPGDPGTLPLDVRRVLVALLKGPYVSHQKDPLLWSALLAHEGVVRRRLGDLLLDLAIDADAEVAFSRNLVPDPDFDSPVPSVLRTAPLSFIDSALLLHLRHLLLQGAARQERVVIGRDEIDAHMQAYVASSGNDEAQFRKRLDASVKRMSEYSILLRTETEDRWEISSILALILTAEEIGGIEEEYERLREAAGRDPDDRDDAPDPDRTEGEDHDEEELR
ncbi:hypothetical protein BF93_17365 [Brachybacterium phenoliresistens]|uniref:DUF4194 domain-containing protein n=1 Tax=Brachybacterium phenoliresistens TaxID=396014 RepID=Z9JU52_9MICO|nr:DUF4194 domain-containing protein [Brachybacterium phenoliresistens]EWS81331.1 hypothetical protein BF93_17365 [Brachybacterium phenoliresistens]